LKFYKMRTAIKVIRTIRNWPLFYADALSLIRPKIVVYRLRNGIAYKTRSRSYDKYVISEIWIDRCYTPEGFEVGEGSLVVDIGAQIGVFTILAAKASRTGRVFSIEPVPWNFDLLESNILLNNVQNVRPMQLAVSHGMGFRELFLSDMSGGHSFLSDLSGSRKIVVEAMSLKDIVERNNIERIDFLKVDCEGAEYEILFNCPDEVLDIIGKISMEVHSMKGNDILTMETYLRGKGFEVISRPHKAAPLSGMIYAQRHDRAIAT